MRFNSTIVRLKDGSANDRGGRYESFNSTIVRLKELRLDVERTCDGLFQFCDSAIKRR